MRSTLITGGRVRGGDPATPWVEAVLVVDGRVVWLGDADSARSYAGGDVEVVNVEGRLVLPGLIDSHNHLRLGTGDDAVHLGGALSLSEIRERIGHWLTAQPSAEWVYGETWEYPAFPGGRRPTAADLDGATGGRPAFLLDLAVHTAWLNREALAALGIGRDTRAMPFGVVEHDPHTGEPTGCVNDFAVHGLSRAGLSYLQDHVPAFSHEAQYERVLASLRMAASFGLTTVVEPQNSVDDIALFVRARQEGHLTSRLVAALFHPADCTPQDLDEFTVTKKTYDDDWLRVAPVKLYIDDTVEPHLAAMLEPYTNKPESSGALYYEPGQLAEVVSELERRGFQCFVHAIGDRGVRTVLDAFESARRTNGPSDTRHQVVHIEASTPEDLARFGQLGVVACMQPRHSRPEINDTWKANVGEQRWPYSWAMQTILRGGGRVALSSDWNTSEMDPMLGIYSATTRARLDGSDPWNPRERLTLEQAIHGYTVDGAWANFAEDTRGTLTVGKYADLVALSNNLFEHGPEAALDTRVDLTMVGGQITHRMI
jgi:predicted amidohydrolase YtcJ